MNLTQYLIAALVVNAVRCNTIGGRLSPKFPRKSREDIDDEFGVKIIGDNRDFTTKGELFNTNDLIEYPSDGIVTSSDIYQFLMTSQTFDEKSLSRVRRGSSKKKKGKRNPSDRNCRKKRKNRKNCRKNKKKGRRAKGRKKCKDNDGKGPPITNTRCSRRKKPSPTPRVEQPVVNHNKTMTEQDYFNGLKMKCVRSTDCPSNWCCARHKYERFCMPPLKLGDICQRPSPKLRKRKRSDFYELCPCEEHLTCKRNKESKEDGDNTTDRLYTCHLNT